MSYAFQSPHAQRDSSHHYDPYSSAATEEQYRSANMTSEKPLYGNAYDKRASGNSIWTKDDKRALSQRSAPAKICRFLIGNLIIGIIIVLSIFLLLVMFLQPPNVGVTGLSVPSQSGVNYQNGAFSFNVSIDIGVSNPNSISASIKKLNATAYDSNDQSTALGSGIITDQHIAKNANTTIQFPFQIKYNQSEDTDLSIIRSLASECGLSLSSSGSSSGTGSGDLSFLLDIKVDVSVLSITVPVSFARNVSFPCPLSASSLSGVLGNLGSALGNLKRDEDELTKRQLVGIPSVDSEAAKRGMSSVEFVAATVDGLLKRYTGSAIPAKRAITADETDAAHDAL